MKTIPNIFLFLSVTLLLSSCKVTLPERQRFDPGAQQTSRSQYPPKIDSFNAYPKFVTPGDSVVLSWKTSHATQVYISGIGQVKPSGSHTIANVNSNQSDIILTASNDGNFAPETKKLKLQPPQSTSPVFKTRPMLYSIAQLNAPQIISPKNDSTFSHYPRTLKLRWRPVSNAASYNVEIDCMHCCASGEWCVDVGKKYKQVKALKNTYFKFNFVGSQPGRWRVQAVNKNGKAGKQSQWYYFKFTK